MKSKNRTLAFEASLFVLMIVMTLTLANRSSSTTLELTLNTSKQTYAIGDKAYIWGNVTFSLEPGEELIPDALVAIEVDNPNGFPVILRTKTTGSLPAAGDVRVQSFISSDQVGTPLSNFTRGTLAYFKMVINNVNGSTEYVEMTLNIFDARNIAYEAFTAFRGPLYNGTTTMVVSDPIPSDISAGNATAYLNVFTALPSTGGYAYCPEAQAGFSITDGNGPPAPSPEQPLSGFYNITFMIDNYQTTRMFRPGNYSVFANCRYQTLSANATKTFEVILTGDINRDGSVDIYDAILLAGAFNARMGDPKWNFNADINADGIVDIYDAIVLAGNFGKTA